MTSHFKTWSLQIWHVYVFKVMLSLYFKMKKTYIVWKLLFLTVQIHEYILYIVLFNSVFTVSCVTMFFAAMMTIQCFHPGKNDYSLHLPEGQWIFIAFTRAHQPTHCFHLSDIDHSGGPGYSLYAPSKYWLLIVLTWKYHISPQNRSYLHYRPPQTLKNLNFCFLLFV